MSREGAGRQVAVELSRLAGESEPDEDWEESPGLYTAYKLVR